MKPIEIQIKTAEGLEAALIECDRRNRALTFTRKDGLKKPIRLTIFMAVLVR